MTIGDVQQERQHLILNIWVLLKCRISMRGKELSQASVHCNPVLLVNCPALLPVKGCTLFMLALHRVLAILLLSRWWWVDIRKMTRYLS